MEAYMGCMLEECVVRACYLRKHGNREGVNKWLIDWSIELELELYFYLDTVNLSDKITIKITNYFNLYKHDPKI